MNRVAADLSWYQKLKRRLALRHNVWHEYQDGLCCEVEFKDGALRYRHGDWCDCSTATQRREFASRRRVDAGGYVPVTELGPPPQGEPALEHGRLRPSRQNSINVVGVAGVVSMVGFEVTIKLTPRDIGAGLKLRDPLPCATL
jgi:hypothetical protein